MSAKGSASDSIAAPQKGTLVDSVRTLDFRGAADVLAPLSDHEIAEILTRISPGRAVEVLEEFPPERRRRIAAETVAGKDWLEGHKFAEGAVGRLVERAPAVFPMQTTIGEAVAALRDIIRERLIVYVFVVDAERRLRGVVAFRELLYSDREQTLEQVMVRDPFALRPETPVLDAMREVVTRHYPVYPVCDEAGHLLGMVRGQVLFEQQAFEISAQAGAMVGVEREERVATPWKRSLWFRHPWLQLNLLTAFVAGAVVGVFQDIVSQIVLLAVFLPILSGQCSNTGCQALAVTLRGMTLNEIEAGTEWRLVGKEAWLGFLNGALVGLVAAAAMAFLAYKQDQDDGLVLASITFVAMTMSCMISGMAGALVPLTLKRMGTDPATASSIFLSTATDVVSMGSFLGLAAWLIQR